MKESGNQRSSGKRLWNQEEDELLSRVVSDLSEQKWSAIAAKFNGAVEMREKGVRRSNKQCRERWQNHLNPILRNDATWSQEEHRMLFTLFSEHSHQWCQISCRLEELGFVRRGDNHVKNYFYSSIKRAIKRINEVVRESNKEIKRQKSILFHYNQKYAYKKRLSLQRQILNASTTDSPSNHPYPHPQPNTHSPAMRIMKELDQEIVSKVLLIAEQKGAKKFTVSNKRYEEEAIQTRNKLISYIQDPLAFTPQDVVLLTVDILELSRKCKRKTCRDEDLQSDHSHPQLPDSKPTLVAHEDKSLSISPQLPKQTQPCCPEPQLQTGRARVRNSDESLLERFLWEENEPANGSKKFVSSEYNRPEETFIQPQEAPKICLDHSNSYFYASNNYSQKGNNPSLGYDLGNSTLDRFANPYNSFAYVDLSYNYSPFDHPHPHPREEKDHTNFAELNFINTIKQIEPRQSLADSQMFDFDLNPNGANMNPFISLFRKESEQERLFCSQVASFNNKASSHRSNHSLSRADKGEVGEQAVEGGCAQLLNRSWAYSSSRLENCRNLFTSNNFERKSNFAIDLHNSNFYPFGNKEP